MLISTQKIVTLFAGAILLCLTSCESSSHSSPTKAHAKISPTTGNKTTGVVTFTTVGNGIKIVADIDGLTPRTTHGLHVHEFGDCSAADGSSAGGHFNPSKKNHGGPDDANRHVGDLGNIVSDDSGHGHYERIDTIISLSGDDSIVGRSIIVHEKEDDFKTQPAGNAGTRLGCGVIVAGD